MLADVDPWVAIALSYPLASPAYRRLLLALLPSRVRGSSLDGYVAIAPASLLALGFLLTHDVGFAGLPVVLVLLPCGFGLYHLESALLSGLSGRPIATRSIPLRRLVPVVPGALAEEVLFRAALAPLLQVGAPLFVGASAVTFGAVHLPNRCEAACKTVDGALYAGLFVVNGSVLAPMLAHVGFNLAYAARVSPIALLDRGGIPAES